MNASLLPPSPARLPVLAVLGIGLTVAALLVIVFGREPMDGSTLFRPSNDIRLLLDASMPAIRLFAEAAARRMGHAVVALCGAARVVAAARGANLGGRYLRSFATSA